MIPRSLVAPRKEGLADPWIIHGLPTSPHVTSGLSMHRPKINFPWIAIRTKRRHNGRMQNDDNLFSTAWISHVQNKPISQSLKMLD